ncbi:MAG: glycosyltransferase family 2 protein [Candidatus Saccharimonadales bacterium]
MAKETKQLISVIIPIYNEQGNVSVIYERLTATLKKINYHYELIFVNDGSTDNTSEELWKIDASDNKVNIIEFSRNFGKESATTAGINNAKGDAAIMIDGDLQHPVMLIPEFIKKWRAGAEVVVGVRRTYGNEPLRKKLVSGLFYKLLNMMAEVRITPHATDYRLIDRIVIDEFNRFSERNRITRGLIDWLGFERDYIYFDIDNRHSGEVAYNLRKLIQLALNSFVGLSLFPLRIAGYLGILITTSAASLGIFVFIEQTILHDPLSLKISGTARLSNINMLLIGIVLMSLGLIALYIANIHTEVINRPLYIVRKKRSKHKK